MSNFGLVPGNIPIVATIDILRAFPRYSGASEQFYDVSTLGWNDKQNITKELEVQGFYVQSVMIQDPMHLLVATELRARMEAERTAEEAKRASGGRGGAG